MASITLRSWQRAALEQFARDERGSFLAVACPGAGKTTFALTAAMRWLGGQRRPIAVVVPTRHLKEQWAESAARFGLHLDPNWTAAQGSPPSDMHGVIVTYAQCATSQVELHAWTTEGLVILDEIHHAAADRAWGDAVQLAFHDSARRLLLSGTPFRSDDGVIPFVTYSDGDFGEVAADYEYGYGEALQDGAVVRPVYFPRFDGHMEWTNAEGETIEATFEDELLTSEWGARLRTALSPNGEWLRTVLGHADRRLREAREQHPNAGGLVIATDHDHARAVADLLRSRHGHEPIIALSDDPHASSLISAFAKSTDPWIVAVRMISEGVDIPRLRVAVYATTTTTPMFFRQAVGRIARWTAGIREQPAWMYLPDDARLRHHAASIAELRRHSIEFRRRREVTDDIAFDEVPTESGPSEQMSLFAALSATAMSESPTEEGIDPLERHVALAEDLEGWPVDLPPPPPLPGRDRFVEQLDIAAQPGSDGPVSRSAEKERLRDLNAVRVQEIVGRTGLGYPQVNTRLNRQVGIDKITEATVTQLQRRLKQADAWVKDITGR